MKLKMKKYMANIDKKYLWAWRFENMKLMTLKFKYDHKTKAAYERNEDEKRKTRKLK